MRGFIKELSYRNVFRVGIAYAIVAWLMAQITDLVVDAFNLPESFLQMVMILLSIGFPIAVILAWAFELTPDGVKRAKDLPEHTSKDPRSGRFLNRLTTITFIVIVAWLGWDKLQSSSDAPTVAPVADKSIAVLPFADFSPGENQSWFADGLTDEILNALSRASDLRVASRTSAFSYRDSEKDIPTIAEEIGVAHILEGSVRRAGDHLRVTAQLIRAADDVQLWSETFDGSSEDSIAIQEQMAFDIANALQTAMDPEELARMVSAGTNSVEAWETYLRAEADLNEGEFDFTAQAMTLLQQAVAIDPMFVDAHITMAELWAGHLNPAQRINMGPDVSNEEAMRRFNESVAAAEANARSEVTRIEYERLRVYMEKRLVERVALSRRFVELRPDSSAAWIDLMEDLIHVGDYKSAQQAGLKAKEIIDENNEPSVGLFMYLHRVDVPAALSLAQQTMASASPTLFDVYQAHRVYLYAGLVEEAAQLAKTYIRDSTEKSSTILLRVRQACAEGRVADADRIYLQLDNSPESVFGNIRWLYLKVLGRDREAAELASQYDNPDGWIFIAGIMTYPAFEPAPFPYFESILKDQGIDRPPAQPIPYACKRE